ncbi:MAG: PKD domain-containing protein, partial [Bacteroidota bacterium]
MKVTRTLFFLFLLIDYSSIKAQVTAGFNVNYPNPNCAPSTVSFINNSTGTGLTYEWNFGVNTGVNSTIANPAFSYLDCGTYTVTLIATDGVDIDTSTQNITVFCNPVAAFNANPLSGCIPLPVTFNSTSTIGSAPITTYFWDFGDGNIGNFNTTNHTYNISGCKSVTLIITDANGCVDDSTMTNLICVDDQPVASFTSSLNISCSAPFNIDFTNTSTGTGVLNYQWVFPGGTPATSTLPNPSVTYNTPGLYDVTLIVTNSSGCSDTLVQTNFAAIASNIADFTMNSASGCVPFVLDVQGIASSVPLAWDWTTTPAALPPTAATQNASFTFNAPGNYQVCLQITYPGGCIANKCTTIVVANYPHANFTLTGNTYTCQPPQIIDYNNTSTGGPGLTYNWQFPGGIPASWGNPNPPNVTYNNCGVYNATLIVTNPAGCSDTFIYAGAANIDCPLASFVAFPPYGCGPLPVNFIYTGTTGTPTSWQWNFGDPSSGAANTSTLQNPNHVYNNVGCYNVHLIVSNAQGCADTVTLPDAVCVGNHPVANFSADPPVSCAYMPIAFTDSSTGTDSTTTYQWDFIGVPPFDIMSTSSNPQYLYPDTGWFDVTLVVCNNGCCDTLTIDSMVHILPPIADFFIESTCADPYNITLHGGSSIAADSFIWITLGGIPSSTSDSLITVNYPSNGTYAIELVVQNFQTGCYDTMDQNIIINNVVADFIADDTAICSPDQVCFTNLSQNATSYVWTMYNGLGAQVWGSNAVDPCRNFNIPGKFSVKLVAIDVNGCTDTMYKSLYIYAYGLNLSFAGNPLSGCIPLLVNFSGAASGTVSTVINYWWNFGDTASGLLDTSSVQNPNHIYNNVGSYDVTLVTLENHGCYDTLMIPQYVNPYQPNVDFTAIDSTVCLGENTCFFNTSFGGSLSYTWDFGDASTSNQFNPCHTYLAVGDYTVTLIGNDTAGCADTMIRNLYIHVTYPQASFTSDSTYSSCPPLPVNFTSTSTGVDANTTYEWYFGDGSNSIVQNPFHIYNIPGFYDVTLIIHNQYGCDDTLTIDSMISITGPTATVSVTPTSGCNPLTVCFIANSNTTTTFTWDFGDGNVVPNSNDSICYTYTIPGTFFPSLILDNGAGCTYSFPIDSIVAGGPNVYWNPDHPVLCEFGTVAFTDSTFGISPITSWFWTFGDSASGIADTSILQNPSHFYDTVGVYIVTLYVTTQNGCDGLLADTIFITPPPTIGISANDSTPCVNTTVNFNYTSNQPINFWSWNFGDPLSGSNDSSALSNPSHTYTSVGNYTVTLIAHGSGACIDTTTLTVTVLALPNPNISANTSVCPNASAQLSASNGITYSWS